jgi:hypothetical protein
MTDDKSSMERSAFGVRRGLSGLSGRSRARGQCGEKVPAPLAIEDDDEDEYDGWVFGVVGLRVVLGRTGAGDGFVRG